MKKIYIISAMNIKLNYFFNNYIKILIIIQFLFFSITILSAQWEKCNNGIVGLGAINCFIVDGNNTYASSDRIYMTTNYGDNWTIKNNGLESNSGTIILTLATNGNNIFAGTMYNGIFLSTDKGKSWVRKSNGLPIKDIFQFDTLYSAIVFTLIINGNNIYAGTDIGVYISTNNGENWIPKNNGFQQLDTFNIPVYSMIISGNNIFVGTKFGVYITPDNGNNWFPKNIGMENLTVYSLAIKQDNIYAATCFGGIFLSTNNGNDWVNIVRKDTCMEKLLIKEKYIFAGGVGVDISSNNGNSWTDKGLKDYAISSMIINDDYIFAGTSSSGIYRAKLSDLGITEVKETKQTNEIKIIPNPASDEFRLRFQTPFETIVQLSVFDLLGNCVLSQTLQSTIGTNEKNINCEKLPQGYYFVKINVNENVQTIPLLIIK